MRRCSAPSVFMISQVAAEQRVGHEQPEAGEETETASTSRGHRRHRRRRSPRKPLMKAPSATPCEKVAMYEPQAKA